MSQSDAEREGPDEGAAAVLDEGDWGEECGEEEPAEADEFVGAFGAVRRPEEGEGGPCGEGGDGDGEGLLRVGGEEGEEFREADDGEDEGRGEGELERGCGEGDEDGGGDGAPVMDGLAGGIGGFEGEGAFCRCGGGEGVRVAGCGGLVVQSDSENRVVFGWPG